MWFWLLIFALGAVTLVGIVFSKLFWWSMAAAGVVWAAGIAIEVFLVLKDELTARQHEKKRVGKPAVAMLPVGELRSDGSKVEGRP